MSRTEQPPLFFTEGAAMRGQLVEVHKFGGQVVTGVLAKIPEDASKNEMAVYHILPERPEDLTTRVIHERDVQSISSATPLQR